MAAMEGKQKCDEIMKLILAEIFYTKIISYNGFCGFTLKNIANPDRKNLIEKHVELIRLLAKCADISIYLDIIPSGFELIREQISSFVTMMDDFSEHILNDNPNESLTEIMHKYPILRESLVNMENFFKMMDDPIVKIFCSSNENI